MNFMIQDANPRWTSKINLSCSQSLPIRDRVSKISEMKYNQNLRFRILSKNISNFARVLTKSEIKLWGVKIWKGSNLIYEILEKICLINTIYKMRDKVFSFEQNLRVFNRHTQQGASPRDSVQRILSNTDFVISAFGFKSFQDIWHLYSIC